MKCIYETGKYVFCNKPEGQHGDVNHPFTEPVLSPLCAAGIHKSGRDYCMDIDFFVCTECHQPVEVNEATR